MTENELEKLSAENELIDNFKSRVYEAYKVWADIYFMFIVVRRRDEKTNKYKKEIDKKVLKI